MILNFPKNHSHGRKDMKLNSSQKSAVWPMTILATYTIVATCVTKQRLNSLFQFSIRHHSQFTVFNSEWCSKYLVDPNNQGVVCLVCQNTIAAMKEYNAKRHYKTKHSSQFDEILGQARVNKIEHLKKSIKNTRCFCQVQERYRTGYKTEH